MKIAMIGQKGAPTRFGGIERHVEALAVRLGRMGHEVTVYTRGWYAAPNRRFAKGVRTVATRTINTKHLDAIVHTFTATIHALRSGADVIHYHGVGPSLLSWIPRLASPRVKVVATFHCIDRKHQKWNALARFALGIGERAACVFPHATITVSKTLQAYCTNRYDDDVRYIPNGIELPRKTGTDIIKKFGLAPNGYVLMVSRLVRHKGAHTLIEAYRRLESRGLVRGKKLVIVGDSAFTDKYVAELKKMAAGSANVLFTGYLKGKALEQMFGNCYAVIHPSESEGLPIAVLEAMSYGKAVLASDIPEITEVTREHGLQFRVRSVNDLGRKLRVLLENKSLAKTKGRDAKAFVLEHYRWDDVAKETERLYRALAEQRVGVKKIRLATARK